MSEESPEVAQGRVWARAVVTLTIAITIAALFVTVMLPFLGAIVWAAVFADALYPLYQRLTTRLRGREGFSAFVLCVGVILIVILPAVYLAMQLGQELVRGIRMFQESLKADAFRPAIDWLTHQPLVSEFANRIEGYFRHSGTDLQTVVLENVRQLAGAAAGTVSAAIGDVVMGTLNVAIVVVTMFFFLRDGNRLITWLCDVLPFPTERPLHLLIRLHMVVRATVYGVGLVALTEGVLGGLAFWILGLPTPVLWGTVMAILAFLPVLGASVVWLPAVVLLLVKGAYVKAVFLALWGGIVIGFLIDYVLRTMVIGRGTQLHVLLAFFSVVGGIAAFGLIGVVAGPLIMATALTLIEFAKVRKAEA